MNSLYGLLEEWRNRPTRPRLRVSDAKRDALIAEHTEGINLAHKLLADELDPFVERLKDLLKDCEDRLAFREKMGKGSKTDLYRIRQELHALIYGEQPPIQEGK